MEWDRSVSVFGIYPSSWISPKRHEETFLRPACFDCLDPWKRSNAIDWSRWGFQSSSSVGPNGTEVMPFFFQILSINGKIHFTIRILVRLRWRFIRNQNNHYRNVYRKPYRHYLGGPIIIGPLEGRTLSSAHCTSKILRLSIARKREDRQWDRRGDQPINQWGRHARENKEEQKDTS